MRLAFVVSVVVAVVLPSAITGPVGDTSVSAQIDHTEKHTPTNWALLRFSDDRKIRKVTIVMFKERGAFGPDRFRPDGKRIEITDQKLLSKIESFFPTLGMAVPDDGRSGGGWGTWCFGRLDIETTDGTFFIAVSFVGFHLDYDGTNFDSVFWSGPLARLIDDIYAVNHKTRITYKGRSLVEQHAFTMLHAGGFSHEVKPHETVPHKKGD